MLDRRGPSLDFIRILVVEDDHGLCDVIAETLRFLGIRHIRTANDGGEAFEELIGQRPDMVLCDIDMEPVSGLDFLAKLRGVADRDVAETPVVFLTGNTEEMTVMRAKELAVNGFLAKPPRAGTIKTAINRCLGTVFD
ncbi:MAG: response regulator [Alphaproteobacteria bacterium]|nr:response regulator [Alphaproteobacteria bacterium SS10]